MNKKVLLILGTVVFGIALLLILYFLKPAKEEGFGVYDHLNKNPGEYERQSKGKYNLFSDTADLTRGNFINSIDPGQIAQANAKMKASMSTSDPTPSSYANTLLGLQTLDTTSELAPSNKIHHEAKKCEALRTRGSCKDLSDPKYASCGICIKGGSPVTYKNTDKHIGGLLVLPEDRQEAEAGGKPYQPTIGHCPEGYFFVDRAKCERESNRLDCKEAGESGGFQGGRTIEGNDVIGQKCAQVPKRGDDQFVYEPKTRTFDVNLRALAPTGTGICKIFVYNNKNQQIGYGINENPGTDFIVRIPGVKEYETLAVVVATEVPYRNKGNSEVFQISSGYDETRDTATNVCKRIGTTIATKSQMNQSLQSGAQLCSAGWGLDFTGYPGQSAWKAPGGPCGSSGFNSWEGVIIGRLASWCYGVKPPESKNKIMPKSIKPFFSTYGVNGFPSQADKPDQWSEYGPTYQAPYERGILLQWEMAKGQANRTLPFEPTIASINGKGPSNTTSSGSRVFKTLRRFGSFAKSTTFVSPKPSGNSRILASQFWIWSNQPLDQQVRFEVQVPGAFVDTFYEEDRMHGSIGPLVGNPDTAKLLRTSPCMKEGQAAGKYSLECLQNLFVSSGGDINSGKLVSDNGGLNQLNAKGDMDTIAAYLTDLYNLATTGKDANGNKVGSNSKEHAQIVNDAAQLMFGFDISTPCEDITEDADGNIVLKHKVGALDADCLDWLWLNTGSDQSRYIGDGGKNIRNTYVSIGDRFSGLTSTEGNKELRSNYPFQTCQRTGSMAPIAKSGALNNVAINNANTKGSIPAIQDYYNTIFQLANNPTSKDRALDQAVAMEMCYGVTKAVPKMAGPKDIPGLFGWFDANDPLNAGSQPENKIQVPIWKDKSGNNNDMKSMGTKPPTCWPRKGHQLYNGLSFIVFDSWSMQKAWYRQIQPAAYPLDVFIVLIINSPNNRNGPTHNVPLPPMDVLGLTEQNSDNFNSLTYGEYTSGKWHNGSSYFRRTPNAVANPTLETNHNLLLMQWSIADNNFYIYRNGVKIMNTNSYTWNPGSVYLQIGNRFMTTTGDNMLNGGVGEVVAFKGQLSDENRQKMEGYLANKWGITANLPSGHPYK